jgi:hypothetical protein
MSDTASLGLGIDMTRPILPAPSMTSIESEVGSTNSVESP